MRYMRALITKSKIIGQYSIESEPSDEENYFQEQQQKWMSTDGYI